MTYIYLKDISKRHLRPFRPRCEWRWGEAWSSATTCTMAKCGVGDTSSDFSGRPGGRGVALGASCNLYEKGNLWCKLASKTQSCWDARRGVPPSDPGLRHGRTPILSKMKRNIETPFIEMMYLDYQSMIITMIHNQFEEIEQ